MQKKDLIEKISEVFSEYIAIRVGQIQTPRVACSARRRLHKHSRAATGHGASGLDVTLLHKALVDLSDKEGDDGSPPIRSPAFQKATQAARVALAAAAPTPAEGLLHSQRRLWVKPSPGAGGVAGGCTTLATT